MKLCDVTECPSPLACDTKDYTQALQDYTQALTNDRGWLRDSAEKRTLDEQHPMPTEDRSRRLALALAAIQKAVRRWRDGSSLPQDFTSADTASSERQAPSRDAAAWRPAARGNTKATR